MEKKKRIKKLLILTIVVIVITIITYFTYHFVMKPVNELFKDQSKLEQLVKEHFFLSRFIFITLMMVQVVIALIPGGPFEMAAGYAFGVIEGMALCLIGIIWGSVIIFILVKKYGYRIIGFFFNEKKIKSIHIFDNPKKLNRICFLIFLIPGTPKDFLTYFVGLTPMNLTTWIAITTFARMPALLVSTWGGKLLNEGHYVKVGIIFVIAAILAYLGKAAFEKVNEKTKKLKQKRKLKKINKQ